MAEVGWAGLVLGAFVGMALTWVLALGLFWAWLRRLEARMALLEEGGSPVVASVAPSLRRFRRVRRPQGLVTPWDREVPERREPIQFPEAWRYEWPDPVPEPQRLPDEEPR